ncbi:SDR family NAD(P)-dependent oxidoreductase [Tessaracoccus antarcticus]|uniref:SDR family NAD(P)-dependent oxidoreductase n=1 Tax=Tessaracoccus antarcticus TaxID=2479848 RepID=A0A3M0G5T9_9ACTN|nr:SDR family NAD(P)-dependent oxidoreductase [Tessaracoccus antarcticus]RMB59928.1 SDR family NAD(P)-dependent oxidoreductase [Tessaracoccus antarcticus]
MHGLEGRLVVITGASRGIGAATAVAVAARGGDVVLLARGRESLDAVAARVRERGVRAWVIPVDLRVDVDAKAAAEAVLQIGVPDVVVANAGHSIARGVLECVERPDSYTRSMGVNFLGTVAFCGPLLAAMVHRNSGHLIGVTTATARIPLPGWGPYVASKAAFDAWLRAAGPELAASGIHVTISRPALVDTGMVVRRRERSRRGVAPERIADQLVGAMLRPRPEISPWWVRPADVASAAAPHTVARLVWAVTRRRAP